MEILTQEFENHFPLETNFSEIQIKIQQFSYNEMYLKVPSAKPSHFVAASLC